MKCGKGVGEDKVFAEGGNWVRCDRQENMAISLAVKTDAVLCIRWDVIESDIE